MFERSSGIGVFLTQLPLAKAKKSSPGFTERSIDAGTMPSSRALDLLGLVRALLAGADGERDGGGEEKEY